MNPLESKNTDVLQWLIKEKFHLESPDDFRNIALVQAASELLSERSAELGRNGNDGQNSTAQVVQMLVAAGQDLSSLDPEVRAMMLGLEYESEVEVSRADFEAGQEPRFGTANPEKMDVPFWNAMVKSGATANSAHLQFAASGNSQPIWSYHREGKSITELPDGRYIEIGGSHEDWDEPHFHVYNDVFVHNPDGTFEIYGYPAEVFPPTDFHSATLVGEFIYIIGCMGHMDQRIIGQTGVYQLNTQTLAIEKIETTGKGPGCISMHQGTLVNNEIQVCGGECTVMFILNLDTHQWHRMAS